MRFHLALCLAAAVAACSHPAPPPAPEPVASNVRVETTDVPAELPIAQGDCAEALRRAAAKPTLTVDRLPAPVSAKPPMASPTAKTLRKDGSADLKIDVLIDTLGKADMKTFTVVTASSPVLVTNAKNVLGKWTFSPAELAGCKVPRVYHLMASIPPRATKPAVTTTKPAATVKKGQ